jgi:hypothetical protein
MELEERLEVLGLCAQLGCTHNSTKIDLRARLPYTPSRPATARPASAWRPGEKPKNNFKNNSK